MALLADAIIEAAAEFKGPRVIKREFDYVAGKIQTAQRFVISPDVRGAIRSLLSSRPSSLLAAAKFARLPYSRCWFEWIPPGEANLHPGQVEVKRCGAIMEPYGDQGFTVFTAWEFNKAALIKSVENEPELLKLVDVAPRFGFSSVLGAYDFADFEQPTKMALDGPSRWFRLRELEREELPTMRDDVRNGIRFAINNDEEWAALKLLETRSAFRVHWETHGAEKIAEQQWTTGSVSSVVHDVQDEMGHLFATLILMNAKNCVQIAKSEPATQLNKARRKRGKTELLPYSTVHIELTKSQQRAVDSGRISREEARRHLVRGHFKVRATGVFWWNETWRGNAARGFVQRKAHIVESGA
jgi:hypothetical protein